MTLEMFTVLFNYRCTSLIFCEVGLTDLYNLIVSKLHLVWTLDSSERHVFNPLYIVMYTWTDVKPQQRLQLYNV